MKRSKVFSGIITGVLALAAFTAAKAHKFGNKAPGYITGGNNLCTAPVGQSWYTKVAEGHTARTMFGRVIYSQNPAGPCIHRLYTMAD